MRSATPRAKTSISKSNRLNVVPWVYIDRARGGGIGSMKRCMAMTTRDGPTNRTLIGICRNRGMSYFSGQLRVVV